jgi:hypothetical protein
MRGPCGLVITIYPGDLMADGNGDLSKWAGVGMAALAAFGGYVGSVSSKSEDSGALKSQVQTIQVAIKEHDDRERDFEDAIRAKVSDIDARVRVLESRK